jgi:hypothetical protein
MENFSRGLLRKNLIDTHIKVIKRLGAPVPYVHQVFPEQKRKLNSR